MFATPLARPWAQPAVVALLAALLPIAAAEAATVTGFSPMRGAAGTEVKIIGSGFGSVRAVEFGGVDARFRIVTSTLVRTWVPEGATTGPIRLVLVDETLSSSPEFVILGSLPPRVAFASPWPNPSSAFRLSFSLPSPARTLLVVLDARGARVRRLADAELSAGPHEYTWDGRDERGRRLSRGVYFARLDAGSETLSRRLVLR